MVQTADIAVSLWKPSGAEKAARPAEAPHPHAEVLDRELMVGALPA
jgi:hypothetical protein